VERWSRVTPSARSSSASRSLTTDFASPSRRDAALIEVSSTVATKAARPSSFIIVRIFRQPVPESAG